MLQRVLTKKENQMRLSCLKKIIVILYVISSITTIHSQVIYTFPKCDSINMGSYSAYVWWNDSLKTQERNAFLVINDYSKLTQVPDSFRFNDILFSKNVCHHYQLDTIDSVATCSCFDSKSWYENGHIKSEILYVDSSGAFYRSYYQNGNFQSEGYINENSFNGLWKYYDSTGKLIKTE